MTPSDIIDAIAAPAGLDLDLAAANDDIAATIPELVRRAARRHGERIAIQEDGLRLTYAALDASRIQAARALMALGVQPGDRVAIWAPNFSEWIIAALATPA